MTDSNDHQSAQADDGWTVKQKGYAQIHTHPEIEGAIADRGGIGMTAAVGSDITWRGTSYPSVADAKAAALASPSLADDEDDEEGICRTCSESYDPYGDGFDGECPDCADKTDQALHPENYEDAELVSEGRAENSEDEG